MADADPFGRTGADADPFGRPPVGPPAGWAPPAPGGGTAGPAGPPPSAWTPPGAHAPTPRRATNGKAIASMVLGILGIVVCPLVCSVPAIVLGYRARKEIAASGGLQDGGSSATAGIVTGWIGTVLSILGIILLGVLALFSAGETSQPGPNDNLSFDTVRLAGGLARAVAGLAL